MKISSDLERLFQELAPVGPYLAHRKIFGYLCALVNGNPFCGISAQAQMFRLPPAEHAAFLRQPGTAPLEPRPWIKRAFEFASRMPEK